VGSLQAPFSEERADFSSVSGFNTDLAATYLGEEVFARLKFGHREKKGSDFA